MSNSTNPYKDNPTWFIDRLTLYQNANSSPEAVKRNFLIRIAEFEHIIADLRSKKAKDPFQHELILGRRGSGKSTLLRRIQIEIDEQADLSEKYIAINLAEEQNAIYRLSDLWFEVLEELRIHLDKSLNLLSFDRFEDNHAYTRYLYAEIHRLLQASGKQVVLLLDNLDRILENFQDDAHLFRETLLNYADLQIIGGSTRMNEHFWRYDQPFYDFFRRHRLEGLSFDEIHRLLNHWSAEMELPVLHDYALRYRGRVEAIRILTDGLPRALQYFIQVLLHDSELYGFDYLKKVMDKATPLYQERLHNLTAPQRKIVQEMAFCWEAVPTKVLVEKCRMESKLIASFLKQLDQYGIVDTIPTGKKNHLYRLSERFFNMWLIVTQGNPDQKRQAKYLTQFLELIYSEHELKFLAKQHLADIKEKKLSYDKAMVLSKGLSQSRFIGVQERDMLIDYTLALKPENVRETELPRKFKEISAEGESCYKRGEYEKALKIIGEIENEEDGIKFYIQAICFNGMKKHKEAEMYFLKAIEKGWAEASNSLAYLYESQGKQTEAEAYYIYSIGKGNVNALNNLAALFSTQGKQVEAEKLFLEATKKGNIAALYNLANLFNTQGKQIDAEAYYLRAIEKGHIAAINNLANLYKKQGRLDESEMYYLSAIEKGDIDAIKYLANLYHEEGNNVLAETYYLQSIENGNMYALNDLAILYYSQNIYPKKALNLIQQYFAQSNDQTYLVNNLLIIKVWNGLFEGLRERIDRILEDIEDEHIPEFLTDLLHHEQTQLVLSLFESEQHGKTLRARYELLYWAVLILAGRTEDNLLLRIPPEVLPTVENIVQKVREKQAFYAKRAE